MKTKRTARKSTGGPTPGSSHTSCSSRVSPIVRFRELSEHAKSALDELVMGTSFIHNEYDWKISIAEDQTNRIRDHLESKQEEHKQDLIKLRAEHSIQVSNLEGALENSEKTISMLKREIQERDGIIEELEKNFDLRPHNCTLNQLDRTLAHHARIFDATRQSLNNVINSLPSPSDRSVIVTQGEK